MTSCHSHQAEPHPAGAVRPLIGVGCVRLPGQKGGHGAQGVSDPYLRAISVAGADAVLIPVGLTASSLARAVAGVDAVLLVGGGDVEPSWYGEERRAQCGTADSERDHSEIALVRVAVAQKKPLLAICRGIQVLNVALGGTLYQDIPTDRPDSTLLHRSPERQALVHSVQLEADSHLAAVVGRREIRVNSMHHQAVRDVASALRAVGWSPDGLVEAVEMPGEVLVMGVQWHPEELIALQEHSRRLFGALAAAASHQSAAFPRGA
ncbi:MAG: gamma-glutamyl-gamma-aminobutyrate hydrolase family protein [Anaerolineae bacterium]|nr:gamma-glutamyl-gamma-aminobutyrate hydrolase family protein [Anaerolineae bacterium]